MPLHFVSPFLSTAFHLALPFLSFFFIALCYVRVYSGSGSGPNCPSRMHVDVFSFSPFISGMNDDVAEQRVTM
ncbi:MAG: hypothetical protein J3R72DRAFT_434831 [Linnemannia gamsii]|nr:MAG: hypothetical protein J3R72DRAFT_434831 [Linnemannia gamsii]